MDNQDYKASFDAIKYDLASIVAMLGFETYPGIDPVLRRLSELLLSQELAVDARGVQASSHPALIALDKQCRDDVARALGLTPSADRGFAWSLLLNRVKEVVADDAKSASAIAEAKAWCDENGGTPAEFLSHQLLVKRCEVLGRPLTWREAIELTALTTSMPDDERDKLLALDDEQFPPCDFCGLIPDYHPWHGSGCLNGEENPHIHACNSCRHKLPGTRGGDA